MLAGTLGMVLMASANELLTAYISLELLSFSSYVLVAYAKTNLKSNEAGMKYIVLGAFSSALLLYGISLVYGTLGTTYFPQIADNIDTLGVGVPGFGVGLCLIFAGLGFKIAAVPFHMWTPDVYEGPPRRSPPTSPWPPRRRASPSSCASWSAPCTPCATSTPPLRPPGRADHDPGQPGRHPAEERQAPAGLLQHRAGRLRHRRYGEPLAASVDIAEQATRGMLLHLAGYYARTWLCSAASSPSRCCATGES